MTLTVIGSPGAVVATSIAVPTHIAGDDIYICAYNGLSDTLPTKPTAGGTVPNWVDISANAGSNGNAMRIAHAIATGSNHTSGVWTNAEDMAIIVIRGQDASPVGGHAESGGSGAESIAPAVSLVNSDGTSMLLEFHGHVTTTTWAAAPSGYTRRAAVGSGRGSGLCLNTKNSTATDGVVAQTITTGTPGGYRGATVEVVVSGSPAPPPSGGASSGAAMWFRR